MDEAIAKEQANEMTKLSIRIFWMHPTFYHFEHTKNEQEFYGCSALMSV